MKVKEVSELTGVSVRTLHHYDQVGLLTPDTITDAGYRIYSDDNLDRLQQILFFRELNFSLKQIKQIMDDPTFDRLEALIMQRDMLLDKMKQLENKITTINQSIQHTKGEISMTNTEKFKGFDFGHNPYEQEARERWGDKAVDQANQKVSTMTDFDRDQFNQIFFDLANIRHLPADSEQAQAQIHDWYVYLNSMGHHYSLEAFKGLGDMYVADSRFTKNIDQFGEGLALFMREAMTIYANNNE